MGLPTSILARVQSLLHTDPKGSFQNANQIKSPSCSLFLKLQPLFVALRIAWGPQHHLQSLQISPGRQPHLPSPPTPAILQLEWIFQFSGQGQPLSRQSLGVCFFAAEVSTRLHPLVPCILTEARWRVTHPLKKYTPLELQGRGGEWPDLGVARLSRPEFEPLPCRLSAVWLWLQSLHC